MKRERASSTQRMRKRESGSQLVIIGLVDLTLHGSKAIAGFWTHLMGWCVAFAANTTHQVEILWKSPAEILGLTQWAVTKIQRHGFLSQFKKNIALYISQLCMYFVLQFMHVLISGSTVEKALAAAVDIEHRALEGCFEIIYECLKQKWPHHTSYPSLLQMCKRLGYSYFSALQVCLWSYYRKTTPNIISCWI